MISPTLFRISGATFCLAAYTASKVELNPKKEVKIDWPKNIKTITEEEYKKEGDKVLSKLGRGW